ncbi:uncharacterized protein FPRO_02583 [Fusarium proliferatum ET1]|uniref:Uncharacterized protein n=1 Tax=Fusarium proliferatum (strain ET1) TaxID=1227346 RepID=A0A1L7V8P5_FUSPR|nr:uncharacterized protein FPRO_02583 [Fusarium proliferatum ET1]CZR37157.1 uncharacterized protein FPRO_02583 [Fusarium proliferatum ET1]
MSIMLVSCLRIKFIVEMFIFYFVYIKYFVGCFEHHLHDMPSIIGCKDITPYQDSKTTYTQPQREKNNNKITQKQNISTISENSTSQNNSSQSLQKKSTSLHHVTKVNNSLVTEP